jgi:hypothetical protein
MDQTFLSAAQVTEAVQLYEKGLTLMEVGLHFGVSQGAARRAVAAEGVEIRPRGRRPLIAAAVASTRSESREGHINLLVDLCFSLFRDVQDRRRWWS